MEIATLFLNNLTFALNCDSFAHLTGLHRKFSQCQCFVGAQDYIGSQHGLESLMLDLKRVNAGLHRSKAEPAGFVCWLISLFICLIIYQSDIGAGDDGPVWVCYGARDRTGQVDVARGHARHEDAAEELENDLAELNLSGREDYYPATTRNQDGVRAGNGA